MLSLFLLPIVSRLPCPILHFFYSFWWHFSSFLLPLHDLVTTTFHVFIYNNFFFFNFVWNLKNTNISSLVCFTHRFYVITIKKMHAGGETVFISAPACSPKSDVQCTYQAGSPSKHGRLLLNDPGNHSDADRPSPGGRGMSTIKRSFDQWIHPKCKRLN